MKADKNYEVIIIGGSFAGLSAAMALGRALRRVLVMDNGNPCNIQTPHSHNFLTQDGKTPVEISALAREQTLRYETVNFRSDTAISATKIKNGFEIKTSSGNAVAGKKLIFATGLTDIMPRIQGFAECWGISILHCPYCHGYEVRNQKTGILANGDEGFRYAQLISNWTGELCLMTNGKSTLTEEQVRKINRRNINVIEREIERIEHDNGKVQHVIFSDQSKLELKAIYSKPDFVQQCKLPEELGCEMTEQGLIKVDAFRKTNIEGVYACGDNSGQRAISVAVATGTTAGSALNHELILEEFNE